MTGLNPFWVFVSILTGARVGGLLGVVVAVPTAVLLREALDAVRSTRKIQAQEGDSPAESALSGHANPADRIPTAEFIEAKETEIVS